MKYSLKFSNPTHLHLAPRKNATLYNVSRKYTMNAMILNSIDVQRVVWLQILISLKVATQLDKEAHGMLIFIDWGIV